MQHSEGKGPALLEFLADLGAGQRGKPCLASLLLFYFAVICLCFFLFVSVCCFRCCCFLYVCFSFVFNGFYFLCLVVFAFDVCFCLYLLCYF